MLNVFYISSITFLRKTIYFVTQTYKEPGARPLNMVTAHNDN